MKIFRHTDKYYLKKIEKGQLTVQQVADILNITIDATDSAYKKYCDKKNPFKKRKIDNTIQITVSIISTVLVLLTLFEMQAERNAAYLPDIFLSNTKVAISWDKNGLPFTSQEAKNIVSKLADENIIINELPQIKVYNIGVGTAKNISFRWNTKQNLNTFINILNSCDDINISYDKNMIYIKTPNTQQNIYESEKKQFDFLLNSTQTFETIAFPFSYYTLIKEFYIRTENTVLPPLYLTASYTDIQGKVYNQSIQINADISFLTKNPDGSGFCIFNLTSIKENRTMNSFEPLNLNSNTLMAITSVCAVLISIISMFFTIIFSLFQIKHNKNSVKPISAIKFGDYENELTIKIENVGTGPLTIKKLLFKNDSQESSTLISMMPPINQLWTTFTESVDGWTIPVGSHLILLQLHPENEEIKSLIRKELSKITVTLEYADIYNTHFQDKRSLNFFGRHFE